MTEHTLKDWTFRVNPEPEGQWNGWVDAPGGVPIANVFDYKDGKRESIGRLISAAPLLLEAAGATLTWWHSIPKHIEEHEPIWLPQLRAAIAAATEEA